MLQVEDGIGFFLFFVLLLPFYSFSYVLLRLREDKGFNASAPRMPLGGHPHQGRVRSQDPIVYTGPLDELFLERFGRLPYRSLDFVYETFDETYHLPCGTVNYTVTEDYTRITEFKWLTEQTGDKTTIMREYSRAYEDPATPDSLLRHHQRRQRRALRRATAA